MKYFVTVNGTPTEVELDADGVHIDGEAARAHLGEVSGTPIRLLSIDGVIHRVVVRRGETRGSYTLWIGGHRFDVEALDERTRAIRQLSGAAGAAAGPQPLRAPMPGLIVRVRVKPGEQVRAGQGLVVMEAMKMENELRAASDGVIAKVNAQPGTAVEKGEVLVELE